MNSIPLQNKEKWQHLFWIKVSVIENCWEWQGHRYNWKGWKYGIYSIEGKEYKAHRVSWTLLKGEIPDGLVIDHLCRNHSCVNPQHLEPVSNAENVRRGVGKKNKTHCINGHPYTKKNVHTYYSSKYPNGRRQCKICSRESQKKSYLRQKKLRQLPYQTKGKH